MKKQIPALGFSRILALQRLLESQFSGIVASALRVPAGLGAVFGLQSVARATLVGYTALLETGVAACVLSTYKKIPL